MSDYIVAAVGNWNRSIFEERTTNLNGKFYFAATPEELEKLLFEIASPKYIFFIHWRWIVPNLIVKKYECICFHMTDVPFGRGGSPLQNLILRGFQNTVLSSLKMDEGIDTGPVYIKYPMKLNGSANEIYRRCTDLSWDMIKEIITKKPIPKQQNGLVTKFKRRLPYQSMIPNDLSISQLYDYIRMLDAEGYPKAFLECNNYKLVFENAEVDGKQIHAKVSILVKDKSI